MSRLRFNHVFFMLMAGAFVCAFILPENFLNPARIHAAGLFNPLSYPIRTLARALERPMAAPPAGELAEENDQLRQEVARLQASVTRLQGLEGERQKLGDLKSLCERVGVSGGDAGGRDGLILSYPLAAHLTQDQAVVYSGGLAGRVQAARGAARVRLITDEGFAVTGAFIRFVDSGGTLTATRINAPTPLVKGLGQGRLAVVGMSLSDYRAAALRLGDWVVLADPQWPAAVQGVRLGQIVGASTMRGAALYVNVLLSPAGDLNKLSDVWVLTSAQ